MLLMGCSRRNVLFPISVLSFFFITVSRSRVKTQCFGLSDFVDIYMYAFYSIALTIDTCLHSRFKSSSKLMFKMLYVSPTQNISYLILIESNVIM